MLSRRRILRYLAGLLAVLVLAPVAATAQTGSIRGSVVDAQSEAILPGANIVVEAVAHRSGTVVDDRGEFVLGELPGGLYRITVSFVGYRTYIRDSLLVGGGRSVSLDIRLRLAPIEVNSITVTATRAPSKLLDAPSAITVLETDELEGRVALTAADHLKTVPAVDIISTGINQSRIVIRGFNDNLASSLLTLVDNRIARIPSIRLTALQLIPLGSQDIDRVEIVAGPASALYGPNSANGVVHIITKSPFDSPGTTATVGLGQNNILSGAVRHAGIASPRLAYKLYGQYYSGSDFEFFDPIELEARNAAIAAGANEDTLKIGARDFDVTNLALQGQVDYRFADNATIVANAGLTTGNNIEASPTGAVQAKNAIVAYGQLQLRYGRLFAQTFYNLLDSRDTYSLRTGQLFLENSSQFVTQVQHSSQWGERQFFTYGVDAYLTRPDSKGTVNGRNEDNDDINEVGVYGQSETSVTPWLDAVLAARVDRHNRVRDLTFSPRVAAVVKPRPGHSLRATFNRAFQTPSPNQLFTDVLGQADVFRGAQLEPLLGFAPISNLRAQSAPETGFSFRTGDNGLNQFRSPYAPIDPRGLATKDFIDLNDPTFTNVMWSVARQAAVAGLAANLAATGLIGEDAIAGIDAALAQVLPATVSGVNNQLRLLDLETQQFHPVAAAGDVKPLSITRTQTFEVGYKGLVAGGLLFGLDVYHSRVRDFVGPFLVATPNVFLDPNTLQSFLFDYLEPLLADPSNSNLNDDLLPLDVIPLLGNDNGNAAEELSIILSQQLASAIPFGTVTPDEAFDPTAVLLTRRNFGDISLSGLDAHFMFYLSRALRVGGNYSYVSKNFFDHRDLGERDESLEVSLNAPRQKYSAIVQYSNASSRIDGEVRLRHVGGFPVRSDVYFGTVSGYTTVDFSLRSQMPFSRNTDVTLTVQNLLDKDHAEFVFTPELGRLAVLRLSHSF